MNIREQLKSIGLDSENSVVIGSGILNALGIRESHDVDVIVNEDLYTKFKNDATFKPADNHCKEVLVKGLFEITTSWNVLGKEWKFDDLISNSIIIDDVRYIPLNFLLEVKKSWMQEPNPRQKDKDDITLIDKYLTTL